MYFFVNGVGPFSVLMVGFRKGLLFPAALNGHTAVLEEFLAAGRVNCCNGAHYLQLSFCLINNMGHTVLHPSFCF